MSVRRALLVLPVVLLAAVAGIRASAQPQAQIPTNLPSAADWKRHLERDILPFWETPAALGTPVGNFPTSRCNDGSVADPKALCAEFAQAPDWIKSTVGRQYLRMLSRQIYLYGVAFQLTGDEKYLTWARAGVRTLIAEALGDKSKGVASYWEGGAAVADPADQTSQDLSYVLVGLSFYYYLTRDPALLPPILGIETYIKRTFYDPRAGLYRWKLKGPDAGKIELVAQLDQANAYMVLLAPLLPKPQQSLWRTELAQIARTIRDRFYDPASAMFFGELDPKPAANGCIYARDDTDFGHTVKTYWMLYFIGRLLHDRDLAAFSRQRAAGIFARAYLPATGSWATQPTCNPPPRELDRTSMWWMAAELDQAALTFGIADPGVLGYIPQTFDFWLKHMVDPRYGEVWDEVTTPEFTPRLPKVHLWKNGFHTAEHALVGYIATGAIRGEPVELYYAFAGCRLPSDLRPYYYDGEVASHAQTPLAEVPGLCRVKVTFARVR